ncbi:MAG: transglutaminase domain-containing protein [Hyphomicrobiaceae bacterium]|nr:MAG: transglutaminase domain-containing protein [Hyphomicrobiaceae bacterium]
MFALVDVPGLGKVPQATNPLRFSTQIDAACAHIDLSAPPSKFETETLLGEFRLKEVIDTAGTELDAARSICSWVHSQFEHDGDISATIDVLDPVAILREAAKGQKFRCVEFAHVLCCALTALGFLARKVGLRTKDVETRARGAGHVVVDVFIQSQPRWVMLDAQFDAVPIHEGRALSPVSLQQYLAVGQPVQFLSSQQLDSDAYQRFIRPYLYFFNVSARDRRDRDTFWDVSLLPIGETAPMRFQGTPYTSPRRLATNSLASFYPREF